MRVAILACVLLAGCLSVQPAEAQMFIVPNMGAPGGGRWYWARPVPSWRYYPRYSRPYYGGYYGRSYGGGGGSVYVRPYMRRDGTFVEGHFRSAPDGLRSNNWSTWPNVNPWTGKPGSGW